MAAYDKIIKYIVDQLHQAMSPLTTITANQQTIISQNEKIIALLMHIRDHVSTPETARPDDEAASE